MSTKRIVLRGGAKLKGTINPGTGDNVLTLNTTTSEVTKIPAIDTTTFVTNSLTSGYLLVGSNLNIATPRQITGQVLFSNLGVTSITPGTITTTHISPTAGILYSQLNLIAGLVNTDIRTTAAIARTKLASGTANVVLINNGSGVMSEAAHMTGSRVVVTDVNGIPTTTAITTTNLLSLDTSSSLTTQLSNKLAFSSALTPVAGDLITFVGGVWTRLSVGTPGQYLVVDGGGTSVEWTTTPNGLPTGGTTGQFLNKIDATNYNTQWSTLTLSLITDINNASVTAATVNALSNFLTTTGTATGSSGQALTIVGGLPTWTTLTGTGTVTSINVSGGTTGLTTSGGPVTTTGTITLAGTLGAVNGGTAQSTVAAGDILYGSALNTWSRLAAGTNGYVLTLVAGIPAWTAAGGGGGFYQTIQNVGTNVTQRAKFNVSGALQAVDNVPSARTDITVATNGISYALFQQPGATSLVGNATGSMANATDIPVGAGLSFSGSTLVVSGITNSMITNGTINLTTKVTGILPYANGGNNSSTSWTQGSVFFAGASAQAQDNANFFWNAASHILSVNTAGDTTGTDSINVYNEIDAYNPNSAQGAIGSGTESGYTFSSSRNTGSSPTVLSSGDLVGGISGWGYTGSSPAYTSLAGMWVTTQGAASTLGGKLDFQTRADGGSLVSRFTVDNTGSLLFNPTGISSTTHKEIFNSRGVTQVDGAGIWLQNSTAAAAGAQQISPAITLEGQGWQTTTPASQSVKFIQDVLPVQGTTNPTGTWRLRQSINGVAYTDILTITTAGLFNFNNGGVAFLNASGFIFQVAGTEKARITTYGTTGALLLGSTSVNAMLYVAQSSAASTWQPAFRIDAGTNTALTANTEFISTDLRGATWTWLDGTVTTQRFNYFRGFTVNKTTTSATFTDIYTQYTDAPTAGTGVTFTRSWAAGFNGNIQTPGIYSSSSLILGSGNTESARFLSSGQFLVGSTAAFSTGGQSGTFQFYHNSSFAGLSLTRVGNDTIGTTLYIGKTRGASSGAFATVVNGDGIGTIGFVGDIGNSNYNGVFAKIAASPDGTVTTTSAPGKLVFSTTPVGGTNTLSVLTMDSSQNSTFSGDVILLAGGKATFNQTTTTAPVRIVGFTSDPSSPNEGELSYNTTSHLFKYYNGSAWTTVGSGTGWAVTGTTTITGNTNQTGAFTNTFSLNGIIISPPAQTGAIPSTLLVQSAAHTNVTAVDFNSLQITGALIQFTGSTGFATERWATIAAPTLRFVSATGTITDAATLAISGAPVQSTNAALTNTHGLLIEVGAVGSATNSYGLTVNAQTGATTNYSAQFLGGTGLLFQQSPQSTSHNFIEIRQATHTGGRPTGLYFLGGGLTNLTAGNESIDIRWVLNRTVQFASNTAIPTQRAFVIDAPIYAFASATGTITDAATFATSAPVVGTNAAITNSHGILIQSTAIGAGVTNSFGVTANAQTGATNNYSAQFIGGLGVKLVDINLVLGTTTGTKIGTATNQKLSMWNATPIVQPTTAIAAATFVANTSGTVNDSATWDGYTIGQIVKALRNIGILA